MIPLLRMAAAPVTLKLSPPSHQLSPYSPHSKRAIFTAALADASNSPDGGPPPISHIEGVNPLTINDQQPPLLIRPQPACNIDGDGNNMSDADTSPNSCDSHSSIAPPCSSFPVHGPFDLLYCIQTGGFGTAWAAKDRSTGRLLCLKVFQSLQNGNVSRSVRAEFRAFRRMVKSKGGERGRQFIMELNRSIQHGCNVFFAMELMTTDLGSYFCVEPERCKLHARRWTAQIALGIESLHEMGIIHRDMKSENILIDSRENIRIIDFGVAYLEPLDRPLCQDDEKAKELVGTLQYMAPEVLRNKGLPVHQRMSYGTAVDWWALGCILFELESWDHQLIFNDEEDIVTYVAWTQMPRQPEQRYPRFEGFNPVVVNLLEGLLQVQPSARYSLNDMEKHDYFLRRDGEFDNAVARALERRIRPELTPQFSGDYESTEVIKAAQLHVVYDWTNLKWATMVGA